MGRATQMQQQGNKLLADVGMITRSVLRIIYDLKEFKIRLQSYDDLKSKDKDTSNAARYSLKQLWLDKVDVMKGNSSISVMARQLGFQTLFDAFYAAENAKNADKLDLNERVKRTVKSRIEEFNIWVKESEKELRKRYKIERIHLENQVNSLKLYSRWAKPYLKAAQQLEQKGIERNPAMVKTFDTILLELTLFGKSVVEPTPEMGEVKSKKKYYQCALVDFYFRGIPQRVQQQRFSFGGRTEVTFRSYVLNEDEIKKLEKELDKSELEDVLNLIEGTTTESLSKLQEEINFFLKEEEEEKKKKEKPKDTSNPFLAMIGYYDRKGEKEKKKDKGKSKEDKDKDDDRPIKKDNWVERTHMRPLGAQAAIDTVFDLFDIFKKAHQMPSYS
jgi:hypothetical protein